MVQCTFLVVTANAAGSVESPLCPCQGPDSRMLGVSLNGIVVSACRLNPPLSLVSSGEECLEFPSNTLVPKWTGFMKWDMKVNCD